MKNSFLKKVTLVLALAFVLVFSLGLMACAGEPCVHNIRIDESVQPTCYKTGLTTGAHCSLCDKVFVAQMEIAKTPHTESEWIVDEVATIHKQGARHTECTVCKEIIKTEIVVKDNSTGLDYSINADGTTCTIIGIGDCTDIEVGIPRKIDDYEVTAIGNRAFEGCRNIISIAIPDTLLSIGEYAFDGCQNLTEIYIKDLEKWCNLEGVKNLMHQNQTFKNLYLNHELVTILEIPEEITEIKPYTFYNCYSLTSVVISKEVQAIGEYAFGNCYKLVEVINKSSHLTVKEGEATNGEVSCYAWSVSNCDKEYKSKVTSSEDGYIVYTDGAQKILLGYSGENSKITVAEGITQIYEYAFWYNEEITSVQLPSTLKYIGSWAFAGCHNLAEVVNNSEYITIEKGMAFNGFVGCYATSVTNKKVEG